LFPKEFTWGILHAALRHINERNQTMETTVKERADELQKLMHTFIQERLKAKLDTLKADDPKGQELQAQYAPSTWLTDAARRAKQLTAVTHTLKPIHPDAKGTSIYIDPRDLAEHDAVGTHCLGGQFDSDVVGNAAALDVYKLLQLKLNETTLLHLANSQDEAFSKALSSNATQGKELMACFASLTEPDTQVATHSLAKQVFWPTSSDAHDDASFHILAPLFPTSLVHQVFKTLQDHRFGEAAKIAREARKLSQFCETPTHDYLGSAIQNFGGTKPQNISQLNSVRRGENFLLASLPPNWVSAELQPLLGRDSMLFSYGRRKSVRKAVRELLDFLKENPSSVMETRRFVSDKVATLADEFFNFTGDYRQLPSGWSLDSACKLSLAQKIWLDTEANIAKLKNDNQAVPQDVPMEICMNFANWLNARLQKTGINAGEVEGQVWAKEIRDRISAELREWTDVDTNAIL
jgi:CRISPR-associated protein Csy1